ncbi:MAG: nucleotidyltransferase [Candidatus Sumerlaeaceae bacterium]
MNTPPPFSALLELFEKHKVVFVIIGGYAVTYHGHPRLTKDLDLLYEYTNENVTRLRSALIDFAFSPEELTDDLFEKGTVVAFGREPNRVDLLNTIDGVDFETVLNGAVQGNWNATPVKYIGREELLANKLASGRPEDLHDVAKLRKLFEET